MHLRTIMRFGFTFAAATAFCLPLAAQEKTAQEKTDPSPIVGSWTWERNGVDGMIRCELEIQHSEDELTGTFKDSAGVKGKVAEVAFEDGVVSFKLAIDGEEKTKEVSFSGKLKGNQITGTQVDSQDKEQKWKASRFTSLATAVGKWQLEFTTPDGTTRNPEFELKEEDGKASIGFSVDETGAGNPKVENIEFKEGVLTFDVSLDFQGQDLLLQYELEIQGDELEGQMRFEFAQIPEQNGEVEVFGKRVK